MFLPIVFTIFVVEFTAPKKLSIIFEEESAFSQNLRSIFSSFERTALIQQKNKAITSEIIHVSIIKPTLNLSFSDHQSESISILQANPNTTPKIIPVNEIRIATVLKNLLFIISYLSMAFVDRNHTFRHNFD